MPEAEKKLTCFVIIGYGEKPSYVDGKVRMLNLDQTYEILIEPVLKSLNIDCYRAIDKNINASIDKLMLQEIVNADIAVVDISTLNANVMWELGVRHARKPHHTIMICEKEQMKSLPFDINHNVIHTYVHSEAGIPYTEVDRFRKYLKETIEKILAQPDPMSDSPVYTFLKDELNAIEQLNRQNDKNTGESFKGLLQRAEKAKDAKDFETALTLFKQAKELATANMAYKGNLNFIISREALCTYKLKQPTEHQGLLKALEILEELTPTSSQDAEVLGLNGSIHKRLHEITGEMTFLDTSIWFYEKGFQLKQDYYTGINAAFMIYKKASIAKEAGDENWEDIKVKADFIRNSVLEITKALETSPDFKDNKDAVWILLTMAEAYNYKKLPAKMLEYENKAIEMAKQQGMDFQLSTYNEQKDKIVKILATLNQ